MKKCLTGLFIIVCAFSAIAQPSVTVVEQRPEYSIIDIIFPQNLNATNQTFNQVQLQACTPWQIKGAPNLPKFAFSILIPNTKQTSIEVLQTTAISFTNTIVLPSKGKLSRIVSPASIPFFYGVEYNQNQLFPSQLATLQTPYILRDFRGQTIQLSPVQYNPISKELIAYKTMRIKVNYFGSSTTNTISTTSLPETIDETFYEIYKNQFVNFNTGNQPFEKKKRYTPIIENNKLLILCPGKYLSSIQPLVEWKKLKGVYTTVVKTDTLTGGVNEATVKNFCKNYYLDHNISAILLIGDNTDIPAMNEASTIPTLFGPSDNAYGYMLNGDHYPDVLVGRMSGNTNAEITNQITKTVQYEKTPYLSTKWYQSAMAIASGEGPGDDGEADWEHLRNISDSLKTQGPLKNKIEFFDGDRLGEDEIGNPTSQNVLDSINLLGCSVINYAGHGSIGGIVTSQFTINEVPLLANENGAWPFVVIVGCKPGYFINVDCWAEKLAWSNTTATNKPTGVVISGMSTVDQWWKEPMECQDEFNGILADARPNKNRTFAGMLVNGMMSMNDKYNVPNDPAGDQMTDTWSIFGDPTLEVRTNNVGPITIGFSNGIPLYATSYSVTCNVDDALICLNYKGEILATAKSIAGVANFSFQQGVNDSLEKVFITATKYNHTPFLGQAIVANFALSIPTIKQNELFILPNPAKDIVVIKSDAVIKQISIFNMIGQELRKQTIKDKNVTIPLQSFPKGIYVLKIQTENQIQTEQLVIE